ncbi:hypothetical protein HK098_006849 [Nowakowskiella sp. JEL0407]|nr:hypothetical protein HK098_006849 [Nowakowskiella sp. JEL0407]
MNKKKRLLDPRKFIVAMFTIYDFCTDVVLIVHLGLIMNESHDPLNIGDILLNGFNSYEGKIYRPVLVLVVILSALGFLWNLYSMFSMRHTNLGMKRWFKRHRLLTFLAVFLGICNPSILIIFSKQVWKFRRAMPMPRFEANKLWASGAIILVIKDIIIAITIWSSPGVMRTFIPFTVFIGCIICLCLFTLLPLALFFSSRLIKPKVKLNDAVLEAGVRLSTVVHLSTRPEVTSATSASASALSPPRKSELSSQLKELEDIISIGSSNTLSAAKKVDSLWETERSAWRKRRLVLVREMARLDSLDSPSSLYVGRTAELSRISTLIQGYLTCKETNIQSRCMYIEGEQGIGKSAFSHKIADQFKQAGGVTFYTSISEELELVSLSTASLFVETYFSETFRGRSTEQRKKFFEEYLVDRNRKHGRDLVPLLNPLIYTGFEETTISKTVMSGAGSLKKIAATLLQVFQNHFRGQFLVFIIDNLQWADLASLELLTEILQLSRPSGIKIYFVLIARPLHSEKPSANQENQPSNTTSHYKPRTQTTEKIRKLPNSTIITLGPMTESECIELYRKFLGKTIQREDKTFKKLVEVTGCIPIFVIRQLEELRSTGASTSLNVSGSRQRRLTTSFDTNSNPISPTKHEHRIEIRSQSGTHLNKLSDPEKNHLDQPQPITSQEIIPRYISQLWPEEQDFLTTISALGNFIEMELMFNTLVKIYSSAKLSHFMGILDQLERKGILIYKHRDFRDDKFFSEGYEFNHSTTRDYVFSVLGADRKRQIYMATAKYMELQLDSGTETHRNSTDSSSPTQSPSDDPETLGDSLCNLIAKTNNTNGYKPFGVIASFFEKGGSYVKAVSYYVVAAEAEIGMCNGKMALQCLSRAQSIVDKVWTGSGDIDNEDGELLPESVVNRIQYLTTLALYQSEFILRGNESAEDLLTKLEIQMTEWKMGLKLMAGAEILSGLLKQSVPVLFSKWNVDETLFWAGSLMNALFSVVGLGTMYPLSAVCWTLKTVNLLEEFAFSTPDLLRAYGFLIFALSQNPSMKKMQNIYLKKGEDLAVEFQDSTANIEFKSFVAYAYAVQGMFEKTENFLQEAKLIINRIPAHPQNYSHYFSISITSNFLLGKFKDAQKILEEELYATLDASHIGQISFEKVYDVENIPETLLLHHLNHKCHFFELAFRTTPHTILSDRIKTKLTHELQMVTKRWTKSKDTEKSSTFRELFLPTITRSFDLRLLASGLLFFTMLEETNTAQFLLGQIFDKLLLSRVNFALLVNEVGPDQYIAALDTVLTDTEVSKKSKKSPALLEISFGQAMVTILEAILRLRSLLPKEASQSIEVQMWFVHGIIEKLCNVFDFMNCDLWIIEGVYAFIHTREVTAVRLMSKALEHSKTYKMKYHEGLIGAYLHEMFREKSNGEEGERARKMMENIKVPDFARISSETGCVYNLIPMQKKLWRGLFKLGKYKDGV